MDYPPERRAAIRQELRRRRMQLFISIPVAIVVGVGGALVLRALELPGVVPKIVALAAFLFIAVMLRRVTHFPCPSCQQTFSKERRRVDLSNLRCVHCDFDLGDDEQPR